MKVHAQVHASKHAQCAWDPTHSRRGVIRARLRIPRESRGHATVPRTATFSPWWLAGSDLLEEWLDAVEGPLELVTVARYVCRAGRTGTFSWLQLRHGLAANPGCLHVSRGKFETRGIRASKTAAASRSLDTDIDLPQLAVGGDPSHYFSSFPPSFLINSLIPNWL
jgi:hypothetical protein